MTPRLERVRRDGEALLAAVAREKYEFHAGLEDAPALRQAHARHPHACDDDALEAARERWSEAAAGTDDWRAARALVEWVSEARVSRALAELDERAAAWEAGALVRMDDGSSIPYARIHAEITDTADRAGRQQLEAARAALVSDGLAPLRRERLERERELVLADGPGGSYTRSFELLSGIDLAALAGSCAAFLSDTSAMAGELVPELLARTLSVPRGEATRPDVRAALRARQFDAAFPAGAMESTVRVQMGAMGLDTRAGGRVRYDLSERAGKRVGARCFPVSVPDEIHLVLTPRGGAGDWRAFLRELGRALHLANVGRGLPFEARLLGDGSVTEGHAMLFEQLMLDPGWLRRYTALGTAQRAEFLRHGALSELLATREQCGRLLYELRLHDGTVPWRSLPDLYVDMLGEATGVRHSAADAFVEVEDRFRVARRLRGRQLQAALVGALRERFDEDWWRNPRTGPWMLEELHRGGRLEPADELALRVASGPLSFAPLTRELETRLS